MKLLLTVAALVAVVYGQDQAKMTVGREFVFMIPALKSETQILDPNAVNVLTLTNVGQVDAAVTVTYKGQPIGEVVEVAVGSMKQISIPYDEENAAGVGALTVNNRVVHVTSEPEPEEGRPSVELFALFEQIFPSTSSLPNPVNKAMTVLPSWALGSQYLVPQQALQAKDAEVTGPMLITGQNPQDQPDKLGINRAQGLSLSVERPAPNTVVQSQLLDFDGAAVFGQDETTPENANVAVMALAGNRRLDMMLPNEVMGSEYPVGPGDYRLYNPNRDELTVMFNGQPRATVPPFQGMQLMVNEPGIISANEQIIRVMKIEEHDFAHVPSTDQFSQLSNIQFVSLGGHSPSNVRIIATADQRGLLRLNSRVIPAMAWNPVDPDSRFFYTDTTTNSVNLNILFTTRRQENSAFTVYVSNEVAAYVPFFRIPGEDTGSK